jgi:hypothetical protein
MKQHPKIKSIISVFFFALILLSVVFTACQKEAEPPPPDPTPNLALDSIVATKTNIIIYEEILITAYARGQNLTYQWKTNHGSMVGLDSVTAKYWACYACIGDNVVECTVSNEFSAISDTIVIHVTLNK